MPKFPRGLDKPSKPKRLKASKPLTHEVLLRSALVSILRRLGKIGHVIPTDLRLLALAKSFVEEGEGLADDQGGLVGVAPFDLAAWQARLSPVGPDKSEIPF